MSTWMTRFWMHPVESNLILWNNRPSKFSFFLDGDMRIENVITTRSNSKRLWTLRKVEGILGDDRNQRRIYNNDFIWNVEWSSFEGALVNHGTLFSPLNYMPHFWLWFNFRWQALAVRQSASQNLLNVSSRTQLDWIGRMFEYFLTLTAQRTSLTILHCWENLDLSGTLSSVSSE